MDFKTFILIASLSYMVAASQGEEDIENDCDNFNDRDETLPDVIIIKAETTTRPIGKYEVTEIIIDIADDRTKGPIISNFTVPRPLNLAPNKTTTPVFIGNVNDTDEGKNEGKKNYISILHVKAEIDDKNDKEEAPANNVNFVTSVKDYLLGIRKGIVNGFNSIIGRKKPDVFDEEFDPNKGPLSFLNKLRL